MNTKNKGFTLIELLVVIAIIAMLLAIVMPAMNKAKMYAEEVMCKSNVHQYQIATDTYAMENKERYPNPWSSFYYDAASATTSCDLPGEAGHRYCRWHNPNFGLQSHPEFAGPYWPYLAVTKANICPTFSKLAPKYGQFHIIGSTGGPCIGAPFEPQFSYSMNAQFNITPTTTTNWQCVLGKTASRSQVKSPSVTFLWAEEDMWQLMTPSGGTLTNSVLNDNALLTPNPTPDTVTPVRSAGNDGFGSFHKVSAAMLNVQQSTGRYNAGMSDVLFVDGHADFIPPYDLKTGENMAAKYKGVVR